MDGGPDTCPRCQYCPKQRGLRVALGFLLVAIVLMTLLFVAPVIGPLLVRLAGLAFLLAVLILFISFIATPNDVESR